MRQLIAGRERPLWSKWIAYPKIRRWRPAAPMRTGPASIDGPPHELTQGYPSARRDSRRNGGSYRRSVSLSLPLWRLRPTELRISGIVRTASQRRWWSQQAREICTVQGAKKAGGQWTSPTALPTPHPPTMRLSRVSCCRRRSRIVMTLHDA